MPAIVYRAVSKHSEPDLRAWLRDQDPARALSVFVGASSRGKPVATSLSRAYELRTETQPQLPLGGVAIPERHARGAEEHLRLIAKQAAGCSFFVTQVVYDVNAAKDLVSDYRYECAAQNLLPVPIVFTFSVCGSMKTLEFLRWLGVDVPRWIANDCAMLMTPSMRPTIRRRAGAPLVGSSAPRSRVCRCRRSSSRPTAVPRCPPPARVAERLN